ncbi:MAG: hypothetical protein ACLPT6_10375 [Desulfobaccales bacterium]
MKELDEINGRLRDGLIFCRKVYDLFEKIRTGPDGVRRLRAREKLEKRLIEELLPVARYVQMRYNHARKIKVKWIDGNQQYDAYLLSSGWEVEHDFVPKKQFLEVTTAVHQKDHLAREHLNKHGATFGTRGMTRDKKTKETISKPTVYTNHEAEDEFVELIKGRINKKVKKQYPKDTLLVIQCVFDTALEWDYIIEKVRSANIVRPFKEICLFDSSAKYFATLYQML